MSYQSDLSETYPTTSSPRQFDKFRVCVISPVSTFLVRLPGLYREQPLPCRVKYIPDTTGGAQVSPKRVITHQTIQTASPQSLELSPGLNSTPAILPGRKYIVFANHVHEMIIIARLAPAFSVASRSLLF